jgi:excisionase family DNA binding protein
MTANHVTPPATGILLLTARQAAAALSVSERTLWTLTQRGDLPAVRIGRSVRYDPGDLRAWIERQKQASAANGAHDASAVGTPQT